MSGEGTITFRFDPSFEVEIFQQKVFRSDYTLYDVRCLLEYLMRRVMGRSEINYIEKIHMGDGLTFSFGKRLKISAKGMQPETIDIEDTIKLAKFIFNNLMK